LSRRRTASPVGTCRFVLIFAVTRVGTTPASTR